MLPTSMRWPANSSKRARRPVSRPDKRELPSTATRKDRWRSPSRSLASSSSSPSSSGWAHSQPGDGHVTDRTAPAKNGSIDGGGRSGERAWTLRVCETAAVPRRRQFATLAERIDHLMMDVFLVDEQERIARLTQHLAPRLRLRQPERRGRGRARSERRLQHIPPRMAPRFAASDHRDRYAPCALSLRLGASGAWQDRKLRVVIRVGGRNGEDLADRLVQTTRRRPGSHESAE